MGSPLYIVVYSVIGSFILSACLARVSLVIGVGAPGPKAKILPIHTEKNTGISYCDIKTFDGGIGRTINRRLLGIGLELLLRITVIL